MNYRGVFAQKKKAVYNVKKARCSRHDKVLSIEKSVDTMVILSPRK